MEMCKPQCYPPVKYGCTSQADLDALAQYYAERGLIYSGMYNEASQECQQQIDSYNQSYLEYESCYATLMEWYEAANVQYEKDLANLFSRGFGFTRFWVGTSSGHSYCLDSIYA